MKYKKFFSCQDMEESSRKDETILPVIMNRLDLLNHVQGDRVSRGSSLHRILPKVNATEHRSNVFVLQTHS